MFLKLINSKIIKLIIGFSLCTIFTPVFANKQTVNDYLSLLPKGSDLSILVQTVDPEPTTLLSYQNDQFKQPASLQKLVTALAAQLELGDDFRFTTRMLADGKIVGNQLKGNLIIQTSGDPTFTRPQLDKMLSTLKAKGINVITGNIIIDASIFAGHDKASGWAWNNLTACYNTPPSAVIIEGNCFYTGVVPAKKVGQKATTTVSPLYPVTVMSDAITIDHKSESIVDQYCEFDVVYRGKNQYQLTGCIKNDKPKTYLRFAVLDDVDYFSAILKSSLKQKNIQLKGNIVASKNRASNKLTTLASNQSEPLPVLLTTMLKDSNNLIADTVFRTIGAHHFGISGTWKNSSDAVKIVLAEKAGINLENAVIVDGSGLSRLNLIDADKMMAMLQYIAANNDTLHLIEMLPVAGVDGTLQYRKSFVNNELRSTIYAKTGYLDGNYNLAGFIKLKDQNYLAFIQFISGYNYQNNEKEPKNSAIIEFEKAIYQAILNNNNIENSTKD